MCYHLFIQNQEMYVMDKMSHTQYFVQQILNGQLLDQPDEVPLGPSLSSLLNTALGQRGISVAAAAELSGINRTSLYKIMDGTVQPQRNTLLRLALTLEMDFEQCQQLLKSGSVAQLSSSRLRDRIILVGLLNKDPLDEISRVLDEQGFVDLYAKF